MLPASPSDAVPPRKLSRATREGALPKSQNRALASRARIEKRCKSPAPPRRPWEPGRALSSWDRAFLSDGLRPRRERISHAVSDSAEGLAPALLFARLQSNLGRRA